VTVQKEVLRFAIKTKNKRSGYQRWPESHIQAPTQLLPKIFKSGSVTNNFSHLRIQLLFRLRLPLMQPKFTYVFTWEIALKGSKILQS